VREKEFLEFNIDNIFVNLYQAEDHLRRLEDTNNDEGHASCVFKHLSFVSGELGEAISHSAVIRPDLTPIFQKLMKEVDEIRHKLSELSIDDAILCANWSLPNKGFNSSNCLNVFSAGLSDNILSRVL